MIESGAITTSYLTIPFRNTGTITENADKIAKKSRKRAVSDEKRQIFTDICEFITKNSEYDAFSVEIPYKKMTIRLNGKTFTLDLIEKREKK
jgi:hypothetical protein